MVVALVLATNLTWKRRLWALLCGLACVHLFLALVIGAMLFNIAHYHPELGLISVSPFWKAIGGCLDNVLENAYLGFSFSVAVLIWITVCFRRNDWQNLLPLPIPRSSGCCTAPTRQTSNVWSASG